MKNIKSIVLSLCVAAMPVAADVLAADVAPKAAAAKPAAPKGPVVKLIDQRMALAADGSGSVTATVQVEGAAPGKIELPFGAWGDVQDFRVDEAPAEVKAELLMKGATPRLALALPANVADSVKLKLSFRKPAPKPVATKDGKGAEKAAEERFKSFSHRFLNGTNIPVERYRLAVDLPEGYVIHTVPEALPKAKATEGKSRVRLDGVNGRRVAVLDAPGLRFADATSMRIEFEREQKSLGVLWFGLILSILYLVFFRDMLQPAGAQAHAEQREIRSHKTHE